MRTGLWTPAADARGRRLLHNPAKAIELVDVQAADVRNVIITHMHYDHAGNCDLFPAATFHLQDREMQYATGRYMAHRCMHEAYSVFDVVRMVRNVYDGRVRFHDGDAELAPGLVLASDASHYYRNMGEERPFPIVADVGGMVEGWRRLRQLADSPEHVIPGHDPQVLVRYPTPSANLRGVVVRLDVGSGSAA